MAGKARRAARKAGHHARMGFGLAGKGLLGMAKNHLVPTAAGAAGELAVEFAADHMEFVQKKFWGGPAVKFGAALLTTKKPQISHGLAGAAGSELYFNYKLKQFQDGKTAKSPVRMFADNAPATASTPANASGPEEADDASALYGSN